ncbi:MAG TPA: hypothetical protein VHQ93_04035 [Chitinophagaceae bacterium]|nr:hypothetical protein [Chitinophagaceae bacterium]
MKLSRTSVAPGISMTPFQVVVLKEFCADELTTIVTNTVEVTKIFIQRDF